MTRQDWIFVGLRLYGVYLLVELAVALPGMLEVWSRSNGLMPQVFQGSLGWGFGSLVVRGVCGVLLTFKTQAICSLLGRGDGNGHAADRHIPASVATQQQRATEDRTE